jgi:hypothetical protein
MPEITSLPPLYVKDTDRLPIPPPRIGGLTRLLGELSIGESATVPRTRADDIYKVGNLLGRSFTARALNEERSRIWRVA